MGEGAGVTAGYAPRQPGTEAVPASVRCRPSSTGGRSSTSRGSASTPGGDAGRSVPADRACRGGSPPGRADRRGAGVGHRHVVVDGRRGVRRAPPRRRRAPGAGGRLRPRARPLGAHPRRPPGRRLVAHGRRAAARRVAGRRGLRRVRAAARLPGRGHRRRGAGQPVRAGFVELLAARTSTCTSGARCVTGCGRSAWPTCAPRPTRRSPCPRRGRSSWRTSRRSATGSSPSGWGTTSTRTSLRSRPAPSTSPRRRWSRRGVEGPA